MNLLQLALTMTMFALSVSESAVGSGAPGSAGAPGGLCPMLAQYVASDGCSVCMCTPDARMSGCSRSACPEPRGNYTINECVEGALYSASDGCNSCQCNAHRRFSSCTRNICRGPPPPPAPAPSPFSSPPPSLSRRRPRPASSTQRPSSSISTTASIFPK